MERRVCTVQADQSAEVPGEEKVLSSGRVLRRSILTVRPGHGVRGGTFLPDVSVHSGSHSVRSAMCPHLSFRTSYLCQPDVI